MNPNRPTFRGTASQLLGIYEKIIGPENYPLVLTSTNTTGRRLQFLDLAATGKVQRDSMSEGQAIQFFESLLECLAMDVVAGQRRFVFDPLKVDDPALFAEDDRNGFLKKPDNALADWCFQLMVRAWLMQKGFGQLTDLRDDPEFSGYGVKVCDFALSGPDLQHELVECKRIHPHPPRPHGQNKIARRKIRRKAKTEAGPQLCSTARRCHDLDRTVVCKHLIVDVSDYESILRYTDKASSLAIQGLTDNDINYIIRGAEDLAHDGIDKLTVCWRNLIYFDGKPRAIVQRALSVRTNRMTEGLFEYEGWTVEGFPLSNSTYREFRVSSVARSLSWIRFGYRDSWKNASTFTLGPEKKC